jgi:hypothetical protein
MGATASVTVATGQKILVDGSMGMWTGTAPGNYRFAVCSRLGTTGAVTSYGTYYGSYTPAANAYLPQSISVVMNGLAAGTYAVGPCGCSPTAVGTLNGDVSFVSAVLMN